MMLIAMKLLGLHAHLEPALSRPDLDLREQQAAEVPLGHRAASVSQGAGDRRLQTKAQRRQEAARL